MGKREEMAGELSRRRHALLVAVVQDFITTAEPIGSHHIASRYSLGVRAATIRNMMAELEAEGYLHQPHTSAGRVPTDKAYRYYVDYLMPTRYIGQSERSRIEYHYSECSRDLGGLMRETSRLLAALTGQTALVVPPPFESVALRHVAFVRVRPGQVIALFVALGGGVHSRLLDTERDFEQAELDRMATYLNENLHGRELGVMRLWIEQALKEDRARYDQLVREALALGTAVVADSIPPEVYVEGSSRALEQPEFNDPLLLRELFKALEDKSALLSLIEHSLSSGTPGVLIGSENSQHRLPELSVVAAAYLGGSSSAGSLAVVGPIRMDYSRVIPLVDYTAKALSRTLSG